LVGDGRGIGSRTHHDPRAAPDFILKNRWPRPLGVLGTGREIGAVLSVRDESGPDFIPLHSLTTSIVSDGALQEVQCSERPDGAVITDVWAQMAALTASALCI